MKIKNSLVINVTKLLLEDAIRKYLYKMFMKSIHELNCEHCGKYFTKAFNLWESLKHKGIIIVILVENHPLNYKI